VLQHHEVARHIGRFPSKRRFRRAPVAAFLLGYSRRIMGTFYRDKVMGKNAEEILQGIGDFANNSVWDGEEGRYLQAAAQIHATQAQIDAQYNATKHLVDCANEVIASQESLAKALVASVNNLTNSINRAADDSGRLASRVAILTLFLVIVGVGQIVATAWPYIVWWFHRPGV
jgi:hypothetical protein